MRDYVERLTEARDLDAVWAELCAAMAGFGFDRLIYAYARFYTGDYERAPEDFMILSNHPPAYMERYVGEALYRDAPMLHWALKNTGACGWGLLLTPGAVDEAGQRVLDFNRQHGVVAGYTISFPKTAPPGHAGVSLAARAGLDQAATDAIWRRDGREIAAMCQIAHWRIAHLPQPVSRKLTQRQRQVLEWVGQGKTTQDIAQIMGLTPGTVEKHLRLAREALDVETTAQAVLKASRQQQIYVLRPAPAPKAG